MRIMESVCRTCRKPTGTVDLRGTSVRYQKPFAEILYECAQSVISPDDALPKTICLECIDRLETCFEFITMCRSSEDFFLQSKDLPCWPVVKQEPIYDDDETAFDEYQPLGYKVKEDPDGSAEQIPLDLKPIEKLENGSESLLVPLRLSAKHRKSSPRKANTKRQREQNKLREANRRANLDPDQRAMLREQNRVRMALKRAAMKGISDPIVAPRAAPKRVHVKSRENTSKREAARRASELINTSGGKGSVWDSVA